MSPDDELQLEAQVLLLALGLPSFYPADVGAHGLGMHDAAARLMDKGLAESALPPRGVAAIRLTPRGEAVAKGFIERLKGVGPGSPCLECGEPGFTCLRVGPAERIFEGWACGEHMNEVTAKLRAQMEDA